MRGNPHRLFRIMWVFVGPRTHRNKQSIKCMRISPLSAWRVYLKPLDSMQDHMETFGIQLNLNRTSWVTSSQPAIVEPKEYQPPSRRG
jgi:hypothetical protein